MILFFSFRCVLSCDTYTLRRTQQRTHKHIVCFVRTKCVFCTRSYINLKKNYEKNYGWKLMIFFSLHFPLFIIYLFPFGLNIGIDAKTLKNIDVKLPNSGEIFTKKNKNTHSNQTNPAIDHFSIEYSYIHSDCSLLHIKSEYFWFFVLLRKYWEETITSLAIKIVNHSKIFTMNRKKNTYTYCNTWNGKCSVCVF